MHSRVSRRAFLGVTGVAASAAMAPRLARAQSAPSLDVEEVECDVAVVGAGFAGLAAAQALMASGLSVSVLEARDRVGGRAYDVRSNGALLPLGAVGIHASQERIASLASRVGVRVAGSGPPSDEVAIDGEVRRTLARLERMGHEFDPDAPWDGAGARARDGRTLRSWIDDTVSGPEARGSLRRLSRAVWGADPGEISLLHALCTVASAGGAGPLLELALAPQVLVDGAQGLAERFGGVLGPRVRLSSPVRAIDQDERGVVVRADAVVARARRAIVALPPALTASIAWAPDLPSARRQLAQRLPLAGAFTVACSYGRLGSPRAAGAMSVDVGPFSVVRDATVPGGPAVLVGQVVGDAATAWAARPAGERRNAALGGLAERFGRWAGRPAEYVEADWQADPYTGGGVGAPVPGALASLGPALRAPFGRVHWAGAEIASRWTGTLEGAVVSGEHAAQEVVASLGRRLPALRV